MKTLAYLYNILVVCQVGWRAVTKSIIKNGKENVLLSKIEDFFYRLWFQTTESQDADICGCSLSLIITSVIVHDSLPVLVYSSLFLLIVLGLAKLCTSKINEENAETHVLKTNRNLSIALLLGTFVILFVNA